MLYPSFYDHLVPGWFDKPLPWRRNFCALSDADRIARVQPFPSDGRA